MAVAGYSRGQIALHWTVFVLVVGQFLFHDAMSAAFDTGIETKVWTFSLGAIFHMMFGLLILLLIVRRFWVRQEHGVPPPPQSDPQIQRIAARTNHFLLYATVTVLPLLGLAAWFGRSETFGNLHSVFTTVLLVLVGLHSAAALFGQFVQHDGVLARMFRPQPHDPTI